MSREKILFGVSSLENSMRDVLFLDILGSGCQTLFLLALSRLFEAFLFDVK